MKATLPEAGRANARIIAAAKKDITTCMLKRPNLSARIPGIMRPNMLGDVRGRVLIIKIRLPVPRSIENRYEISSQMY